MPNIIAPSELDKLEELRRNLGVTSLNNTFANFKQLPGTDKAFKAFYDFSTLLTPKPLLLCYGGVGNGKTHLLEAAAIEFYRRGIFVRVLHFFNILSLMKASMNDKEAVPSYDQVLRTMCEANILLLDDVGSGSGDSKWAYTILEDVISYRAERFMTAITTNRDPKELPERVVSRFRDNAFSILVLNNGNDYRKSRKNVNEVSTKEKELPRL